MTVKDNIYEGYRLVRRLIERSEACCEKDHKHEPLFKDWQKAINIFDNLDAGYAERYEKEKNNESGS